MNKHIFYIAAACAALASCVKNEVRVNAPDQEITFQTVSTKAADPFNEDNHFFSYAYFLAGDNWDDNHGDAQLYFNAEIFCHKDHPNTKFWKAANPYYWPKQGSLTFFAWTDNTAAPSVGTGATVSCEHNTGIKIENYSVKGNNNENKNKDILVADIAKNKKSNESATGTWEKGVPTVFRHALAKVEFQVNKKEDYKNVKFNVTSITLNNVSTKGTFTQGSPTENWGWSDQTEPDNLTVFTGDQEVATTATQLKPNTTTDYSIVLPQNFDNDTPTLTIEYEIYYTGTKVKETVKETKALKDIYKSTTSTSKWESKTKYVLGITLGLNEIYWDPSIVDWDNTVTVQF